MTHATGLGNTNFYYVTPQGGYYLIPQPSAQPAPAAALPPLSALPPAIPDVDAIGRRFLQPRLAFAPLHNLTTLAPQPLAASPHISVGLEKVLIEKMAQNRRLDSMRADRKVEDLSVSKPVQAIVSPINNPSNPFYSTLPTSYLPVPIMIKRELPPLPPEPQQGAVPAAAVQTLPQQQAQPAASEKSAGLKRQAPVESARRPLDFKHRTPDSFRVQKKAEKIKTESDLPEPQPVSIPDVPASRKTRKAPAQPKEKPAAAHLDFTATLTPQNYQAEREKAKARYIDSYYETSEESKEASEWISKAVQYLEAKEYTDAVTALHLAFEKLPHDGFIYKLLDNTEFDVALSLHPERRICTSDPEEDLDVLVLRGIRKIKHGKYEEAEHSLHRVLDQKPNDQLARLLLDNASRLSDQYLQSELRKDLAESATNYDSVKLE